MIFSETAFCHQKMFFLYETIWRSIDGVKVKTEEFGL